MAAATQKIIIHADDKTGSAIASAVRNSKKLDKQIQRTGEKMRTATRQSRAHLGQLGHQVQDVAVQFQMGMNPLMILGQQGSQVASIFGTKGALFGGILAVSALLVQQLVPSLGETNRELKDLLDIADRAGKKLAEIAPRRVSKEQQEFADALEEAKANLQAEIEELERLKVAQKTATATAAAMPETLLSIGAANENAAATSAQFATAMEIQKDKIEAAKNAVLEATQALEEFREQVGLTDEAASGMRVELPTPPTVQEFTPEDDPLEGLKRRAEALKRSLDPMKEYQAELQELQAMEANNLITTAEFTQAVKELREQFVETGDEAERFGLTLDDAKRTGIDSLEDGLVGLIEGTKSVKEAFSDMARSVISDLIRMQIQQSVTNPLAAALGIKRGAAIGGPVEGGRPYLVGEKGPELMVPNGSGRVIPNNRLGGGEAPVNVTLNISTGVAQTVRTEIASLMPQITNATKAAVVEARRRGGSFANAFGA